MSNGISLNSIKNNLTSKLLITRQRKRRLKEKYHKATMRFDRISPFKFISNSPQVRMKFPNEGQFKTDKDKERTMMTKEKDLKNEK